MRRLLRNIEKVIVEKKQLNHKKYILNFTIMRIELNNANDDNSVVGFPSIDRFVNSNCVYCSNSFS